VVTAQVNGLELAVAPATVQGLIHFAGGAHPLPPPPLHRSLTATQRWAAAARHCGRRTRPARATSRR
jgi:hypothetical protein